MTDSIKTEIDDGVRGRIKQLENNLNDKFKDIKITLLTIDTIIQYYIKEVMKPKTLMDNMLIDIPILYANKERWNSAKKEGIIRDKNNQIMSPIIIYRRTNMSKNDKVGVNKIQADNPQLFYTFTQKYSKDNKYCSFDVINNVKPKITYRNIIFPDFVILKYDFAIWTYNMEDMNYLLELINFHSNSYWGNDRFKFKTDIDGFNTEEQLSEDGKRIIMSEFSLEVNGYIIPEIYSNFVNNFKVNNVTKTQINFDTEIVMK